MGSNIEITMKLKNFCFKSLAVLVSLACALAATEIIIRVLNLAPEVGVISVGRYRLSKNPKIGYEPTPNYEYEGADLYNYNEYRGVSNNLGFRDSDHAIGKAPGSFRVLVIGDSIAFGLLVPEQKNTFTYILEGLLDRRGLHSEVLNFAVAGYNTQQEVWTLIDKGLRYQPDLIVLQYCLNDTEEVNGELMERLEEIAKGGKTVDKNASPSFFLRSATYRFLAFRVFHQKTKKLARAHDLLAQDTVEENFALLGQISKSNNIPVLVAVFPMFHSMANQRLDQYPRIANYSASNGFYHLDLREAFKYVAPGPQHDSVVAYDIYHPTPTGHRIAANAIADFICSNKLYQRK